MGVEPRHQALDRAGLLDVPLIEPVFGYEHPAVVSAPAPTGMESCWSEMRRSCMISRLWASR